MSDYRGVIIEESLENKAILKEVQILSTRVSQVTDKHKTPWVSQWTLHEVLIPESHAAECVKKISQSIDHTHNAWYADFRNSTHHYIVFRDKVFFVDRKSQAEYDAAKQYGIALGIPEHQVDFHPAVAKWEQTQ
ncbi:MAG: hypothetical protein FJY98_01120 [Candidatus Liptonbacteria bacterium]|nr:hypothetical protein [Candidatus Liptonbacteria bacterium]